MYPCSRCSRIHRCDDSPIVHPSPSRCSSTKLNPFIAVDSCVPSQHQVPRRVYLTMMTLPVHANDEHLAPHFWPPYPLAPVPHHLPATARREFALPLPPGLDPVQESQAQVPRVLDPSASAIRLNADLESVTNALKHLTRLASWIVSRMSVRPVIWLHHSTLTFHSDVSVSSPARTHTHLCNVRLTRLLRSIYLKHALLVARVANMLLTERPSCLDAVLPAVSHTQSRSLTLTVCGAPTTCTRGRTRYSPAGIRTRPSLVRPAMVFSRLLLSTPLTR